MLDDAPEVTVNSHLEDPPAQVSSIKTRLGRLATGAWDLLKKVTERLSPTVTGTPATPASPMVLEPVVDPVDFPQSVPQNTFITIEHRRFDWGKFSRDLLIEVMKVERELKPVINCKAPPLFIWPENKAWNTGERLAHRLKIPTPSYVEIAESAVPSLEKRADKHKATFNNWLWTWAYVNPDQEEDQDRIPDKYPISVLFTIMWMAGLHQASVKKNTTVDKLFTDRDRSDLILFLARCTEVLDPRVRKALSHYGHVPILYRSCDGTQYYEGTDTLWADKGNAMYSWLCKKKGYFAEYNLNAESHGDLMEVCFNLCYMHTVLGSNLPELFQFDSTYLSTWSLQWAMLHRELHMLSMSGIADITDKHPNGPGCEKKTRLETACKYYSLISKLQVQEEIKYIDGKRSHEPWVTMACNCMYCGEPISQTKHWYTISAATQAIWTHLSVCDKATHNDGLGPGLTSDDIKPFDNYPALIEARQSKEGLLSFDSILEESLVRCMESVMHSRVKCFESLVANCGPECDHAVNGCEIYHHDTATKGPWVSTFNIPLLESIASGHFFDRTLAAPDEVKISRRCLRITVGVWNC